MQLEKETMRGVNHIIFGCLNFLILIAFLLLCQSYAFGQSAPQIPSIRNYQDYLIMMRAMNDFAREHGMEPKKPLTKREWKNFYGQDKSNESDKQEFEQKSEKEKLLNSNFGDFCKAKKVKKSGKIELKVWDRYAENMKVFSVKYGKGDYGKKEIDGDMSKDVEYDEIWIRQRTEYLTPSEIKKFKGTLDLNKLYWKNGEIQAFTAERYYIADPVTKAPLSNPGHKVWQIYNREFILKEIKK